MSQMTFFLAKGGDRFFEIMFDIGKLGQCHGLHILAWFGLEKYIHDSIFLYKELDINVRDGKGRTPLAVAVAFGREDITKFLLDQENVNVNTRNICGETLISSTITKNKDPSRLVNLLIQRKDLDINSQCQTSHNLLRSVMMIEKRLGATEYVPDIPKTNSRNKHVVLKINNILTIYDISMCSHLDKSTGESILSHATFAGLESIARLILQREDLNVNAKDKLGITAFHHAAAFCSVELFNDFLSRPDLDINATYGNDQHSILSLLINCFQENKLKLLLQQKRLDVNVPDRHGETALMDAVWFGNENMVKLLLSRSDIDINAKNVHGDCALSLAVRFGDTAIVQLLHEAGGSATHQLSTITDGFELRLH